MEDNLSLQIKHLFVRDWSKEHCGRQRHSNIVHSHLQIVVHDVEAHNPVLHIIVLMSIHCRHIRPNGVNVLLG